MFLFARTRISGLKSFSPLLWEVKQSKLLTPTAGQSAVEVLGVTWEMTLHGNAEQPGLSVSVCLCVSDAVDVWCCEMDVLCSLAACLEMHLVWWQPWFGVWEECFGVCQVCTRAGKGIMYLMFFPLMIWSSQVPDYDVLEGSEISIRNQWGLVWILFHLMNVFIVDLGLSTLMNFSESPQIWHFSGNVRDESHEVRNRGKNRWEKCSRDL